MLTTAENPTVRVRKEYVLKLYVTGVTRRSQRAITNLNAICAEHLQGEYDLEVVDIYQSPLLARDANILASPTSIKQLPLPVRRLIGDLSEENRVLMLLDLKAKTRSHDQASSISK